MLPLIQIISLVLIIVGGYISNKLFGIIGIAFTVLVVRNLEIAVVNIITNKIFSFKFKFKNLYILYLVIVASVLVLNEITTRFDNNLPYTIPFFTLLLAAPILIRKELNNIFNLIIKK